MKRTFIFLLISSLFLFSIQIAAAADAVGIGTFTSSFWIAGIIMFIAGAAGAVLAKGIGFVGGAAFGLVLDIASGIVDAVYIFVLALILVAMSALILGGKKE